MFRKLWHFILLLCIMLLFFFPISLPASAFQQEDSFERFESKVFAKSKTPEQSSPSVQLEMYNNSRDNTCNTVSPWFKLYNTGTSDLNLKDVEIRYFFTNDGEEGQNFWCDWSNVGSSKVIGSFTKLQTPMVGADYYLQISFKNGAKSIKPGEYVEIQSRFAKTDWSNFNQLNDYSFNQDSSVFINWDKTAVYVNNALVWGFEPQSPAPTPIPVKKLDIKMCNTKVHDKTNTLYPRFILSNSGNVPIDLQEVRIRYYFTIDGEKEQNFWCDWSSIGASNVTGNFVKLTEPMDKADYYMELGFKASAGILKPGDQVEIHTRIAKSNWEDYTQTNDYSYTDSKHDYILWNKVTAFIGDEMIWGDQTLLGKPIIFSAEANENTIRLIWSPIEGYKNYDIEDSGTVVGSVYSNSFNHIGLPAGTFHQYRVRVTTSTLIGSWSDSYDIWTLPDIPCDIVTEATENTISIIWGQVTGATGYDIEVDGILSEDVSSPFVHMDLQPGTMHQYRIRAKNSSGYGEWTELINKWTIPDRVSELNTYATQTVVVVSWEEITGATAYDIEFDGKMLEELLPSVSVTDLMPGTLHEYRVRAKNDSGTGAWSEEYSYWTIPDVANKVSSSASETHIEITWDNVIGATGYDIEVDGEILEDQVSPYAYMALESGTRHTFRIRAKNSSGIGYWNEALEVWTLPGRVEGIEIQGFQNEIIIQWEPVRGAAAYEVKADDNITEISSSPYIHEGLTPGTLYKYVIRAINSSGAGVWSNEVTQWTIPDKVKNTDLTATETEITVFWEDVTGATGYDIEADGILYEDVSSPYLYQGLSEGSKHTFRLRAKNSSGYGFWNDEIEKWTIPSIPEDITITSGETYLFVAWNEVIGATGYDLKINDIQLEDVTNPFTKPDLLPGTEYFLTVRAKNGSGAGKWSEPIHEWTIPSVVERLEMQASQTDIQIRWENVIGAAGYDMEIDGQLLTDVESPYLYQDLQPGTEHSITVRAKNSGGIGRWCEAQTIWTLPGIPKNMNTQPASNSIKIAWDPVTGATGYDIEIYGTAVDVGSQEWYVHEGINPNNQQTYRVRAKNSSGAGEWSAYIAETTLPGIPSYIRTEATDKEIMISWDAIPGSLTYDLEVNGAVIIGLDKTEYKHKGLQPNTVYAYRIRSNGTGGPTAWSEAAECSTLFSPPDSIDAVLSSTQIHLSWSPVEGAVGYEVEIDGQIYDNGRNVSYLHSGLVPDSQHTYRVRAKNHLTKGLWSQPLVKSTRLEAPQNICGESSGTKIIVSWDMVNGAASYDIEADGQIISNGLSAQYQHTGLEPNSAHTYRVRAWNKEGAGEWCAPVELYTLVGVPYDIHTFSTSTEINVHWNDVPSATGYDIMVDGNIYDNGNSTSYKHAAIEPNSMHLYQIRAKRGYDDGEWSEVISARALVGFPTGLDTVAFSRQIKIAWDEVNGATYYDVEINGDIIANITENCHTQTDLEPNTICKVRIRAKNELGNSEWSQYAECMTAPDIPSALSAAETSFEVVLNWNPVEGAVSYDIEADGIVISDILGQSYVHSGLKPNTRHTYRIRSQNEHTVSEWSDYLTQLTTPEIAVPTRKDVIFNFVIVAPQKEGISERTIVVSYNPEELEVFDLCALTPHPETETGLIEGTNVSVVEFIPGKIVYKISNADKTVVQIIKFLSNMSGHSKVTYTIQ